MQVQEPVYDNLVTTAEDHLGALNDPISARVRRRPLGKSLRSRLSQIVSMYVPSSSTPDHRLDFTTDLTNDHTGLLSQNEMRIEFSDGKQDELYDIELLYVGDQLTRSVMQRLHITYHADSKLKINTVAVDGHTIYVGFQNLPYIFLLSADGNPQHSEKTESPIKDHLYLHSPGIGDIVPKEICINNHPSFKYPVLYVVGQVLQLHQDSKLSQTKWVLIKFNVKGKQLARTKVYNYQRYSGLSIDVYDGNLLLACPTLNETDGIDKKHMGTDLKSMAGQLCKLTPGFERRVFSITMGKDMVIYKPNYVTQETAGQCCWASVERWSKSVPTKENGDGVGEFSISRRLFAFPSRQRSGSDKQSPREWLQVLSWEFADLNPGHIAAYNSDCLLVTDCQTGTLSYIVWPQTQNKPSLCRITRPTSKPIHLLCTNFDARNQDTENHNQTAYFVSGMDIYSFRFRNQSYLSC